MTTANQTKDAAQKVAGKMAGAYSATKGWVAKQYAKPSTKILLGAALGAAAAVGVQRYERTHPNSWMNRTTVGVHTRAI